MATDFLDNNGTEAEVPSNSATDPSPQYNPALTGLGQQKGNIADRAPIDLGHDPVRFEGPSKGFDYFDDIQSKLVDNISGSVTGKLPPVGPGLIETLGMLPRPGVPNITPIDASDAKAVAAYIDKMPGIAPKPFEGATYTPYEYTKRYVSHYGYVGSAESENYNALRQGVMQKALYGVGKFTTTMLKATVNGTVGLVDGIAEAVYHGQWSKLFDNETSRFLDAHITPFEEAMPHFYSDAEASKSWYDPGRWLTSNMFFDKFLGTMGFVASIYATRGASMGSLLRLSKAATFALRAGKGAEALSEMERLAVMATRGVKNTDDILAVAKKFNVTDITRVLGTEAKAFAQNMRIADSIADKVATGMATAGEAMFEAIDYKNKAETDMLNRFRERYGRNPNEQEAAILQGDIERASNVVYALNMATLGISNYVQVPKWFGRSYTAERGKFASEIGKLEVKDAAGNLMAKKVATGVMGSSSTSAEKEVVKDVLDGGVYAAVKGGKRPMWIDKATWMPDWSRTALRRAYSPIGFVANMEMVEEGLQYAYQTGAEEYMNRRVDGDSESLLKSIAVRGISRVFTDDEGMESMILGGIVGGLMPAVGNYYKKRGVNANTAKAVTEFNQYSVSNYTKAVMKSQIANVSIQADIQRAQAAGNVQVGKDLEATETFNTIIPRVQYGEEQRLRDEIEEMRKIPFERVKNILELDDTVTEEDFHKHLKKLDDQIDVVKDIYESLNYRFLGKKKTLLNVDEDDNEFALPIAGQVGNLSAPSSNVGATKAERKALKAQENYTSSEILNLMVMPAYMAANADSRINDLRDELVGSGVDAENLRLLTDKTAREDADVQNILNTINKQVLDMDPLGKRDKRGSTLADKLEDMENLINRREKHMNDFNLTKDTFGEEGRYKNFAREGYLKERRDEFLDKDKYGMFEYLSLHATSELDLSEKSALRKRFNKAFQAFMESGSLNDLAYLVEVKVARELLTDAMKNQLFNRINELMEELISKADPKTDIGAAFYQLISDVVFEPNYIADVNAELAALGLTMPSGAPLEMTDITKATIASGNGYKAIQSILGEMLALEVAYPGNKEDIRLAFKLDKLVPTNLRTAAGVDPLANSTQGLTGILDLLVNEAKLGADSLFVQLSMINKYRTSLLNELGATGFDSLLEMPTDNLLRRQIADSYTEDFSRIEEDVKTLVESGSEEADPSLLDDIEKLLATIPILREVFKDRASRIIDSPEFMNFFEELDTMEDALKEMHKKVQAMVANRAKFQQKASHFVMAQHLAMVGLKPNGDVDDPDTVALLEALMGVDAVVRMKEALAKEAEAIKVNEEERKTDPSKAIYEHNLYGIVAAVQEKMQQVYQEDSTDKALADFIAHLRNKESQNGQKMTLLEGMKGPDYGSYKSVMNYNHPNAKPFAENQYGAVAGTELSLLTAIEDAVSSIALRPGEISKDLYDENNPDSVNKMGVTLKAINSMVTGHGSVERLAMELEEAGDKAVVAITEVVLGAIRSKALNDTVIAMKSMIPVTQIMESERILYEEANAKRHAAEAKGKLASLSNDMFVPTPQQRIAIRETLNWFFNQEVKKEGLISYMNGVIGSGKTSSVLSYFLRIANDIVSSADNFQELDADQLEAFRKEYGTSLNILAVSDRESSATSVANSLGQTDVVTADKLIGYLDALAPEDKPKFIIFDEYAREELSKVEPLTKELETHGVTKIIATGDVFQISKNTNKSQYYYKTGINIVTSLSVSYRSTLPVLETVQSYFKGQAKEIANFNGAVYEESPGGILLGVRGSSYDASNRVAQRQEMLELLNSRPDIPGKKTALIVYTPADVAEFASLVPSHVEVVVAEDAQSNTFDEVFIWMPYVKPKEKGINTAIYTSIRARDFVYIGSVKSNNRALDRGVVEKIKSDNEQAVRQNTVNGHKQLEEQLAIVEYILSGTVAAPKAAAATTTVTTTSVDPDETLAEENEEKIAEVEGLADGYRGVDPEDDAEVENDYKNEAEEADLNEQSRDAYGSGNTGTLEVSFNDGSLNKSDNVSAADRKKFKESSGTRSSLNIEYATNNGIAFALRRLLGGTNPPYKNVSDIPIKAVPVVKTQKNRSGSEVKYVQVILVTENPETGEIIELGALTNKGQSNSGGVSDTDLLDVTKAVQELNDKIFAKTITDKEIEVFSTESSTYKITDAATGKVLTMPLDVLKPMNPVTGAAKASHGFHNLAELPGLKGIRINSMEAISYEYGNKETPQGVLSSLLSWINTMLSKTPLGKIDNKKAYENVEIVQIKNVFDKEKVAKKTNLPSSFFNYHHYYAIISKGQVRADGTTHESKSHVIHLIPKKLSSDNALHNEQVIKPLAHFNTLIQKTETALREKVLGFKDATKASRVKEVVIKPIVANMLRTSGFKGTVAEIAAKLYDFDIDPRLDGAAQDESAIQQVTDYVHRGMVYSMQLGATDDNNVNNEAVKGLGFLKSYGLFETLIGLAADEYWKAGVKDSKATLEERIAEEVKYIQIDSSAKHKSGKSYKELRGGVNAMMSLNVLSALVKDGSITKDMLLDMTELDAMAYTRLNTVANNKTGAKTHNTRNSANSHAVIQNIMNGLATAFPVVTFQGDAKKVPLFWASVVRKTEKKSATIGKSTKADKEVFRPSGFHILTPSSKSRYLLGTLNRNKLYYNLIFKAAQDWKAFNSKETTYEPTLPMDEATIDEILSFQNAEELMMALTVTRREGVTKKLYTHHTTKPKTATEEEIKKYAFLYDKLTKEILRPGPPTSSDLAAILDSFQGSGETETNLRMDPRFLHNGERFIGDSNKASGTTVNAEVEPVFNPDFFKELRNAGKDAKSTKKKREFRTRANTHKNYFKKGKSSKTAEIDFIEATLESRFSNASPGGLNVAAVPSKRGGSSAQSSAAPGSVTEEEIKDTMDALEIADQTKWSEVSRLTPLSANQGSYKERVHLHEVIARKYHNDKSTNTNPSYVAAVEAVLFGTNPPSKKRTEVSNEAELALIKGANIKIAPVDAFSKVNDLFGKAFMSAYNLAKLADRKLSFKVIDVTNDSITLGGVGKSTATFSLEIFDEIYLAGNGEVVSKKSGGSPLSKEIPFANKTTLDQTAVYDYMAKRMNMGALSSLTDGDVLRILNGTQMAMELGGDYWGYFKRGITYLEKNAEGRVFETVVRHELFHGIFRYFLTSQERDALYAEAENRYGKGLTTTQLEEKMAEEYMDKKSKKKATGIWAKFMEWVRSLVRFFNDNSSKLDELFESIDKGDFASNPISASVLEQGAPLSKLYKSVNRNIDIVDYMTLKLTRHAGEQAGGLSSFKVTKKSNGEIVYDKFPKTRAEIKNSFANELWERREELQNEVDHSEDGVDTLAEHEKAELAFLDVIFKDENSRADGNWVSIDAMFEHQYPENYRIVVDDSILSESASTDTAYIDYTAIGRGDSTDDPSNDDEHDGDVFAQIKDKEDSRKGENPYEALTQSVRDFVSSIFYENERTDGGGKEKVQVPVKDVIAFLYNRLNGGIDTSDFTAMDKLIRAKIKTDENSQDADVHKAVTDSISNVLTNASVSSLPFMDNSGVAINSKITLDTTSTMFLDENVFELSLSVMAELNDAYSKNKDNLTADEILIYNAIQNWIGANPGVPIKMVRTVGTNSKLFFQAISKATGFSIPTINAIWNNNKSRSIIKDLMQKFNSLEKLNLYHVLADFGKVSIKNNEASRKGEGVSNKHYRSQAITKFLAMAQSKVAFDDRVGNILKGVDAATRDILTERITNISRTVKAVFGPKGYITDDTQRDKFIASAFKNLGLSAGSVFRIAPKIDRYDLANGLFNLLFITNKAVVKETKRDESLIEGIEGEGVSLGDSFLEDVKNLIYEDEKASDGLSVIAKVLSKQSGYREFPIAVRKLGTFRSQFAFSNTTNQHSVLRDILKFSPEAAEGAEWLKGIFYQMNPFVAKLESTKTATNKRKLGTELRTLDGSSYTKAQMTNSTELVDELEKHYWNRLISGEFLDAFSKSGNNYIQTLSVASNNTTVRGVDVPVIKTTETAKQMLEDAVMQELLRAHPDTEVETVVSKFSLVDGKWKSVPTKIKTKPFNTSQYRKNWTKSSLDHGDHIVDYTKYVTLKGDVINLMEASPADKKRHAKKIAEAIFANLNLRINKLAIEFEEHNKTAIKFHGKAAFKYMIDFGTGSLQSIYRNTLAPMHNLAFGKDDALLDFSESANLNLTAKSSVVGAQDPIVYNMTAAHITPLIRAWYLNYYINGHFVNQVMLGDQANIGGPRIYSKRNTAGIGQQMIASDSKLTENEDQSVSVFTKSVYADASYRIMAIEDIPREVNFSLGGIINTGLSSDLLDDKDWKSFESTDGGGWMTPRRRDNIRNGMSAGFTLGSINKPLVSGKDSNGIHRMVKYAVTTLEDGLLKAEYKQLHNTKTIDITEKQATELKALPYLLNVRISLDTHGLVGAEKDRASDIMKVLILNENWAGREKTRIELQYELDQLFKKNEHLYAGEAVYLSAIKIGTPAEGSYVKNVKDSYELEPFTDSAVISMKNSDWRLQLKAETDPEKNNSVSLPTQNTHNVTANAGIVDTLPLVRSQIALSKRMSLATRRLRGSLGLGTTKVLTLDSPQSVKELQESAQKVNRKLLVTASKNLAKGGHKDSMARVLVAGANINIPFVTREVIMQMSSLFKNKVLKPKFDGGKFVMAAAVPTGENGKGLDPQFDEKTNIAEVYLPFSWLDKIPGLQGELVGKTPTEIEAFLKTFPLMMGYRIPSTDINSAFRFRVKGFFHTESNIVIAPSAVVKRLGADFDVDTLYFMRPDFYAPEKESFAADMLSKFKTKAIADKYEKLLTGIDLSLGTGLYGIRGIEPVGYVPKVDKNGKPLNEYELLEDFEKKLARSVKTITDLAHNNTFINEEKGRVETHGQSKKEGKLGKDEQDALFDIKNMLEDIQDSLYSNQYLFNMMEVLADSGLLPIITSEIQLTLSENVGDNSVMDGIAESMSWGNKDILNNDGNAKTGDFDSIDYADMDYSSVLKAFHKGLIDEDTVFNIRQAIVEEKGHLTNPSDNRAIQDSNSASKAMVGLAADAQKTSIYTYNSVKPMVDRNGEESYSFEAVSYEDKYHFEVEAEVKDEVTGEVKIQRVSITEMPKSRKGLDGNTINGSYSALVNLSIDDVKMARIALMFFNKFTSSMFFAAINSGLGLRFASSVARQPVIRTVSKFFNRYNENTDKAALELLDDFTARVLPNSPKIVEKIKNSVFNQQDASKWNKFKSFNAAEEYIETIEVLTSTNKVDKIATKKAKNEAYREFLTVQYSTLTLYNKLNSLGEASKKITHVLDVLKGNPLTLEGFKKVENALMDIYEMPADTYKLRDAAGERILGSTVKLLNTLFPRGSRFLPVKASFPIKNVNLLSHPLIQEAIKQLDVLRQAQNQGVIISSPAAVVTAEISTKLSGLKFAETKRDFKNNERTLSIEAQEDFAMYMLSTEKARYTDPLTGEKLEVSMDVNEDVYDGNVKVTYKTADGTRVEKTSEPFGSLVRTEKQKEKKKSSKGLVAFIDNFHAKTGVLQLLPELSTNEFLSSLQYSAQGGKYSANLNDKVIYFQNMEFMDPGTIERMRIHFLALVEHDPIYAMEALKYSLHVYAFGLTGSNFIQAVAPNFYAEALNGAFANISDEVFGNPKETARKHIVPYMLNMAGRVAKDAAVSKNLEVNKKGIAIKEIGGSTVVYGATIKVDKDSQESEVKAPLIVVNESFNKRNVYIKVAKDESLHYYQKLTYNGKFAWDPYQGDEQFPGIEHFYPSSALNISENFIETKGDKTFLKVSNVIENLSALKNSVVIKVASGTGILNSAEKAKYYTFNKGEVSKAPDNIAQEKNNKERREILKEIEGKVDGRRMSFEDKQERYAKLSELSEEFFSLYGSYQITEISKEQADTILALSTISMIPSDTHIEAVDTSSAEFLSDKVNKNEMLHLLHLTDVLANNRTSSVETASTQDNLFPKGLLVEAVSENLEKIATKIRKDFLYKLGLKLSIIPSNTQLMKYVLDLLNFENGGIGTEENIVELVQHDQKLEEAATETEEAVEGESKLEVEVPVNIVKEKTEKSLNSVSNKVLKLTGINNQGITLNDGVQIKNKGTLLALSYLWNIQTKSPMLPKTAAELKEKALYSDAPKPTPPAPKKRGTEKKKNATSKAKRQADTFTEHDSLVEATAIALSAQFNVPHEMITEAQAMEINPDYDGGPAFYLGGKGYLVKGKASRESALHEIFGHPILDIIQRENPELIEKLFAEASQDDSVVKHVTENYPELLDSNGRLSQDAKHEVVLKAMELSYRNRINRPALVRLLNTLWEKFLRILKKLFKVPNITSSTTISDLIGLALYGKIDLGVFADERLRKMSAAAAAGTTYVPAGAPTNITVDHAAETISTLHMLFGDVALDPNSKEYVNSNNPASLYNRGTEWITKKFAVDGGTEKDIPRIIAIKKFRENGKSFDETFRTQDAYGNMLPDLDKDIRVISFKETKVNAAGSKTTSTIYLSASEAIEHYRAKYELSRQRGNIMHKMVEKLVALTHDDFDKAEKLQEDIEAIDRLYPGEGLEKQYSWIYNDTYRDSLLLQYGDDLLAAAQDGRLFTEFTVFSDELGLGEDGKGIATTIDMLGVSPSGNLIMIDNKSGSLDSDAGIAYMFNYAQMTTQKGYANSKLNRAMMEQSLRAFIIKMQMPEARFDTIGIMKINKRRAGEMVHVDMNPFLAMMAAHLKSTDPALYTKLKADGLFNLKNYYSSMPNHVELAVDPADANAFRDLTIKHTMDSISALTKTKRDLALIKVKTIAELAQAQDIDRELNKQVDRMFDLNYVSAKEIRGSNYSDIGLLKRYFLPWYDVDHPAVYAYFRSFEENRMNRTKEYENITQELRELQKKLYDEHSAAGHATNRQVDRFIPLVSGFSFTKEDGTGLYDFAYKKVQLASYVDADGNMNSDSGTGLVTPTDPEWNTLTQVQKDFLNFYHAKLSSVFQEVMDQPIEYSRDKVFNKSDEKGNYDLNNAKTRGSIEQRNGGKVTDSVVDDLGQLRRDFLFRVPIKNEELTERFGMLNWKSYPKITSLFGLKHLVKTAAELEIDRETIPLKYMPTSTNLNDDTISKDLGYVFEESLNNLLDLKHYHGQYQAGLMLRDYFADHKGDKFKNTAAWFDDVLTAVILGKKKRVKAFTNLGFIDPTDGVRKEVDFDHIAKMLRSMTTHSSLILHIPNAMTNLFTITMQNIRKTGSIGALSMLDSGFNKGNSALTYDKLNANLAKSLKPYLEMQKTYVEGNFRENKLWLLLDQLKYKPESYDYIQGKEQPFGKATVSGLIDKGFTPHNTVEDFATITLFYALMNTMTHPKNGKTLWELYEVVEKVNPETGTTYKALEYMPGKTDEEQTRFVRKLDVDGKEHFIKVKGIEPEELINIKRFYQEMQGNYRLEERPAIEATEWGALFVQFRKFMPSQWSNWLLSTREKDRTRGVWNAQGLVDIVDPVTGVTRQETHMEWQGRRVEGRINTVLKIAQYYFLNSSIGGRIASKFGIKTKANEDYAWDKLNDIQKERLMHIAMMFLAAVSLGILKGMIGWDDDDMKKDAVAMRFRRIQEDVWESISPLDALRAIKEPAVSLSKLYKLTTGLGKAIPSFIFDDLTQDGDIRGMSDVQKSIMFLNGNYAMSRFMEDFQSMVDIN